MQQVLGLGALNQPQMCSQGGWTHVDGLVRENSTGKCTSILHLQSGCYGSNAGRSEA